MNNKKMLVIVLLVLVLLIGGASVLYDQLGRTMTPDQIVVQEPVKQEEPQQTEDAGREETTAPEPMTAPDFQVYDGEGNEVRLSDYFGKPIVLNFWASWCGPCQMEMPDFHEKHLELGDDVAFLMVNMTDGARETVEGAAEFVAGNGYTFPVFYDTQSSAAAAYGVYSLPTTYFIDAQGQPIAQATGAINAETLQRGIDMILG